MRLLLAVTLAGAVWVPDLLAQGVSTSAAAFVSSELNSELRLGYEAAPLGPARVTLGVIRLGASPGDRWGASLDLALRFGSGVRVYPLAGIAAGWGAGAVPETWGGWSGGLGYELLGGERFTLAVEGRYHRLSSPGDAVSIGVRVAYRTRPPPSSPANTPALRTAAATSPLAAGVVQSALDVMGTPYVWGGTDANGFDCSGLIQYAYGRHGITLPRRSQEQASMGITVPLDTLALQPGDILAFGDRPGVITHVGLYLGDGRFIHSSSRGVRVSLLRPNDPDGGYWWRRWHGARRVLPPA